MFGDGPLTFHEFAMREPLPLATIHDAVLEFLRGRKDAVLFGAQAVNAYVKEERMTHDVDIASTRVPELADELREYLNERFNIAVCVSSIGDFSGCRIYQAREPRNRHLVDLRLVKKLPPAKLVENVLVVAVPELIANKVTSMVRRARTPKSFTDRADLFRLLLAFPELKEEVGPVAERLEAARANFEVLVAWKELVATRIEAEEEDDKFAR